MTELVNAYPVDHQMVVDAKVGHADQASAQHVRFSWSQTLSCLQHVECLLSPKFSTSERGYAKLFRPLWNDRY